MAANTTPIFPLTPKVLWGKLGVENTLTDGTGSVVTVFTAGANGSRIDQIKLRALGTNIATVVRFFVNNGQPNTTATNNSLVHEVTMDATTASQVAALADKDVTILKNSVETIVPIPFLPAGYKINCTCGSNVSASGGIAVTVHGSDY